MTCPRCDSADLRIVTALIGGRLWHCPHCGHRWRIVATPQPFPPGGPVPGDAPHCPDCHAPGVEITRPGDTSRCWRCPRCTREWWQGQHSPEPAPEQPELLAPWLRAFAPEE